MSQTLQIEISKNIITGIAITILIFIMAVYIPILGFFFALLIPLPILFYRSKLGRRMGAIVAVASGMLFSLFLGGIGIDMLFFGELLLLGFVLAEFFEKDFPIETTVCYTCGIVLLAGIASLIFYGNFSDTGIFTVISEYVEKNLKLTIAVYEKIGMPQESIHAISSSLDMIHYVLVRIIPALLISFTLFVIWIILLMAKPILTNKGLFYPNFGHLIFWKPPEILVWGVIGSGVMLLLPDKGIKIFALNCLIILMTIYFFSGIAIISFYFEKKEFPVIFRFLLYSLIAIQHIMLILVIGLGFFDMWVNFRKLGNEN